MVVILVRMAIVIVMQGSMIFSAFVYRTMSELKDTPADVKSMNILEDSCGHRYMVRGESPAPSTIPILTCVTSVYAEILIRYQQLFFLGQFECSDSRSLHLA